MNVNRTGNRLLLLDQLSAQELEIYHTVQAAAGNARALNRNLQQQGLFKQYRQIYQAYVALSSFKMERAVRNEALKRAIFLGWYSELEPAAFTGLADLAEDKVTEVYLLLNKVVERGWMNEELAWMLRHYARWGWVILQYTENKIHGVSKLIKSMDTPGLSLPLPEIEKRSMDKRGLMGLYFKEVYMEEGW